MINEYAQAAAAISYLMNHVQANLAKYFVFVNTSSPV